MDNLSLAEKTIWLLEHRDRKLTFRKIATEIGVTESWLNSLVSDTPPRDPGSNSIQRLYEFLSGKKLVY